MENKSSQQRLMGKNPVSWQVDIEWVPIEKLDEIRLYPQELGKKKNCSSQY